MTNQVSPDIVREWKELEVLEGNSYCGAKMRLLVDAYLQLHAELSQVKKFEGLYDDAIEILEPYFRFNPTLSQQNELLPPSLLDALPVLLDAWKELQQLRAERAGLLEWVENRCSDNEYTAYNAIRDRLTETQNQTPTETDMEE